MPSKKAPKTDTEAELLLLSQIEKFAAENDFDIDLLYDVALAEELFGVELKLLEHHIEDCDAMMSWIAKQNADGWKQCCDAISMAEFLMIDIRGPAPLKYQALLDTIRESDRSLKRKRNAYQRRAWEIRTYIKACHRCKDLSKSYASISQTVTQHMWGSVWRGAGLA